MSTTMATTTTATEYHLSLRAASPEAEPCHLLLLPSELRLEVLSYLEDKRDLYRVSQVCKWMEDLVLKRLYKILEVQIPEEKSSAWSTGGYLTLRTHVVRAIQDLSIRDDYRDIPQSHNRKRRRSDVTCPRNYTNRLLAKVPEQQLKRFEFMHKSPLSSSTFQLLGGRHGKSLSHLSCFSMQSLPSCSTELNSLTSFECCSIENGRCLAHIVTASRASLRSLKLGQERDLLEQYQRAHCSYLAQDPGPILDFRETIDLSHLPCLKSLTFTGIDASLLIAHSLPESFYLASLKELTLESCNGSAAFLAAMTSTFHFLQSPSALDAKRAPALKKFLLRSETFTVTLKEMLVQFLASFTGLTTLSLLFENASVLERVPNIIGQHGETLQCLTLESRIQPRTTLVMDTSRPFGQGGYSTQAWEDSLNDICNSSQHLTELGLAFPWKDESIRRHPSPLSRLHDLRTMHIRNFPESQTSSHIGESTIKEHATKFIEWMYRDNSHSEDQPPPLELLSIGPTLYEARHKGSNPSRPELPEWLTTHHFMVDWAKTRFGKWTPMVTGVSERYIEEVRDQKPLAGVFEQVWLK